MIPRGKICGLSFGLLTSDELDRRAVDNLTNSVSKRNTTTTGSVCDGRLGCPNANFICLTCGSTLEECQGHPGKLDLFQPVCNVFFLPFLPKILSSVCIRCSRILLYDDVIQRLKTSKLPNYKKRVPEIFNLTLKNRVCWFGRNESEADEKPRLLDIHEALERGYCGSPQPKVWLKDENIVLRPCFMVLAEFEVSNLPEITPRHVYQVLKGVSKETTFMFGFNKDRSPLHAMMMPSLVIPPCTIRPSRTFFSEDDLTVRLRKIQKVNEDGLENQKRFGEPNLVMGLLLDDKMIQTMAAGKPLTATAFKKCKRIQGTMSTIHTKRNASVVPECLDSYFDIQRHIAMYFDSKYAQHLDADYPGREKFSLKSRFAANATRSNRVREYLMGKRLENCGRGVLSPCTTQEVNEIGIPVFMAKRLTVKEDVNAFNYNFALARVLNYPNYPCANYIKRGKDVKFLPDANKGGLQFRDVVARQLQDSDTLIVNRQPSLHKHSMMAHKAVIHGDNTLKSHLGVGGAYGEDFDGDEKNVYVPHGKKALAEADVLLAVEENMLKDGRLLIGFVQHAVLGAFKLTSAPIPLLGKNEVFQLIMNGCNDDLVDEALDAWPRAYGEEKEECKEEKGLDGLKPILTGREIMQMLLPTYDGEKPIVKSSLNGCFLKLMKIHSDNSVHIKRLGFLTRILEAYCIECGISISVRDCVVKVPPRVIDAAKELRDRACQLSEQNNHGKRDHEIENNICDMLSGARDIMGSFAIEDLESRPGNCGLLDVIHSGAKGNLTHITQNTVVVGLQLNGNSERNKKSTSHAYIDDIAKFGYAARGFMNGLTMLEFYLHAASARFGLISGAIQTSDIGYLYRKLYTILSNKRTAFDNTVRNASGYIIMFKYGFDTSSLTMYNIKSLLSQTSAQIMQELKIEDPHDSNIESALMEVNHLISLRSKLFKKRIVQKEVAIPVDVHVLRFVLKSILPNFTTQPTFEISNNISLSKVREAVKSMWSDLVVNWLVPNDEIQELVFFDMMSIFHLRDVGALQSTTHLETTLKYVHTRYRTCMADTGSPVGYFASQNLAEPLTNMTLKRFHIAGERTSLVGGLARLKEIINLVKSIATPSMEIYIEPDYVKIFDPLCLVELRLKSIISHWADLPACGMTNEQHRDKIIQQTPEGQMHYDYFDEVNLREDQKSDVILTLYFDKEKMMTRHLPPRIVCNLMRERSKVLSSCNRVYITFASLEEDKWWISITIFKKSNIFKLLCGKDVSIQDASPIPLLSSKLYNVLMHEKILLAGIDGITDFYKTTKQIDVVQDGIMSEERLVYVTLGSNLQDACLLQGVDVEFTTTNDIHQIYDVYGIDAAMTSIEQNISETMNNSDANVSSKHISLIAHVMCQSGKPAALTFSGMTSKRNPCSYFKAALFERPLVSFFNAAVSGQEDDLRGVGESIVAGTTMTLGTGADVKMLPTTNSHIRRCAERHHNNNLKMAARQNVDMQEKIHPPCLDKYFQTKHFEPSLIIDCPLTEEKMEDTKYETKYEPDSKRDKKKKVQLQLEFNIPDDFMPSSPVHGTNLGEWQIPDHFKPSSPSRKKNNKTKKCH